MEETEEIKKKIASPDYPNSIEKIRELSPKKRKSLDSDREKLISDLGILNDPTVYNRNLKLKEINDATESQESQKLKKMINQRLKSLENKSSNNPEKPEKTDEKKIVGKTKTLFCPNCPKLLISGKCPKCGEIWDYVGEGRRIITSEAPKYKERKIGGEKK